MKLFKNPADLLWKAFVSACLIIVLIFCLTSCISQKRRDKICQSCATHTETKTKDSIGVPEVKQIPFDTLALIKRHIGEIQVFNNCDSLKAALLKSKDSSIVTVKDGVKGTISGKGGKLKFVCETDSLKEVIRLLRKEITNNHFHSAETVKEVPQCFKPHKTETDIFWIKVGKWLLGILIGYVILRLLKRYLKTTFPLIAKWIP